MTDGRPGSSRRAAVFHPEFREDFRHWVRADRRIALRVLDIVEALIRDTTTEPRNGRVLRPSRHVPLAEFLKATSFGEVVTSTLTPARSSIAISVSMLNRSILPLTR